jgi:hypothetical protein
LPGYYFDTSALAKLYRLEVGSDVVDPADQKLCRVAALEGFLVTNPEQPASVVI